jgi:hypothetical protein
MQSLVRIVALASSIAILAPAVSLSAQANLPPKTTWKLNLAKSKFGAAPAPQSVTVMAEVLPNGMKFDVQGVAADGKPIAIQYTSTNDGKDYPVTGSPRNDTESSKRIDSTTTEVTRKKGGKVVETGTVVMSKDAKTVTVTNRGTDAKGKKITWVEVFERQ